MKLFLLLKAWQVFILLPGIPLISQVVALSLLTRVVNGQAFIWVFVGEMILFVGVLFSWIFAIGNQLHRLVLVEASPSLTVFRITFSILLIYIIGVLIGIVGKTLSAPYLSQLSPVVFLVIIPLHLLSMACIFYCLHFDAKVLRLVELQRPVTFADFVGEFFLLWFNFVGVWIIQPRLNNIARQQLT